MLLTSPRRVLNVDGGSVGTGARFIHLWAQHVQYLNVTPEGVGRGNQAGSGWTNDRRDPPERLMGN